MKKRISLFALLALIAFTMFTACTPDDDNTNEDNTRLVGTWIQQEVSPTALMATFFFEADGTGRYKEEKVNADTSNKAIFRAFNFDFDGELLTIQFTQEGDGYNYLCSLNGDQMTLTTTAYVYKDGHVDSYTEPEVRVFKRTAKNN